MKTRHWGKSKWSIKTMKRNSKDKWTTAYVISNRWLCRLLGFPLLPLRTRSMHMSQTEVTKSCMLASWIRYCWLLKNELYCISWGRETAAGSVTFFKWAESGLAVECHLILLVWNTILVFCRFFGIHTSFPAMQFWPQTQPRKARIWTNQVKRSSTP